jgi:hypothetical protein
LLNSENASVPFAFDLHAMLYSDNAPELENALHQLLEDRRVNLERQEGVLSKRGT